MSNTTATHPQGTQAHTRARRTRRLGRYLALDSKQQREVLRIQRPDGSALVVDYERGSPDDGRLVAHLAPDEPAENAQIVCDLYLADESRGRCRPISPQDFEVTRHAAPATATVQDTAPADALLDADSYIYCLRESPVAEASLGDSRRELRWTRSRLPGRGDTFDTVSLYQVIGSVQAYEPARTITEDALARDAEHVRTRRLAEELDRLAASPIVLNRQLRCEVQHRVERGEVSMSQIALRCGQVKRDARGNLSGETSWLARRIGLMPEADQQTPCPWIHSDVLARIARDGLGISPREVEL